GYWERYLHAWDLVGGAAIVIGAGGQATDLDGRAFDGLTGRVLATNGRIHDEFIRVLEDVARREGSPWP
ncbi:MAG TPA: inositol monophosphatase family protein, partial [Polyangia bacterium]